MHERISNHIRGNVVGYVAVFIALSGTAYAVDGPLPGQNQVGSADIINGEVKTGDIGNGAVRTADVLDDDLRSEDILDGEIEAIDVAFNTLRGDHIQDGTLGGSDLAGDTVTGANVDESTLFNDNSLTAADLANSSVGKGELGAASVGASEVGDGVVERPGTAVTVNEGVEGNGDVNINQATASCNAGEEIVGGNGEWNDLFSPAPPIDQTPGDEELYTVEVDVDAAAETVKAIGANDTDAFHNFRAVALCLNV